MQSVQPPEDSDFPFETSDFPFEVDNNPPIVGGPAPEPADDDTTPIPADGGTPSEETPSKDPVQSEEIQSEEAPPEQAPSEQAPPGAVDANEAPDLARPLDGGQRGEPDPPAFSVALPLRGRRVLVVGGGDSATAMVTALRASGALIRVVAFTLTPALTELGARGLIEVANRQYQARDLADAWLAFACSDHRSVNAALAFDAERARIWCVTPEDAARPPPAPVPAPAGRRALVLGGARSGKSATAQAMLTGCAAVDYVATGHRPGQGCPEWDERVRRHQARRPDHWRTIETLDVASVLAEPEPSAAVLIDCLATWLAQTMDDCGVRAQSEDADKQLAARQDELVQAWTNTPRRVVAVSNEVGSGVVPTTGSGRRFRDELGWLNSRIAAVADEVWLCVAGIPTRLR